ncbi:hypothetical protein [Nocardia abscessus]|uniref:hypothetical protein n=1 Tax=Nocardia abscessus TaxID=120957 RepID=UPI002455E96F|nr:hypothetical protein [Nocardia abscessus]
MQERLGGQVDERDALRRQRRCGVEQCRAVVQRMHRGALDAFPELLQQRVALCGEEPLPVAQEPGRAQCLQRRPDHPKAEQAGRAHADLVALGLLAPHHGDRASSLIQAAGLPALLPGQSGEAGQVFQQESGATGSPPDRVGAARPDVPHDLLDLLDASGGEVAARHRRCGRFRWLAAEPGEARGRD